MAGSMRFDLGSGCSEEAGFAGGYINGQRRNFSGPNFAERAGGLKEGGEKRGIVSGMGNPRGGCMRVSNEVALISQCLALDPILTSDHKFIKSSELRRAIGLSLGNNSEAAPFGTSHSKPITSVVTDEMKKLKSILADACMKARGRSKRLDESLHKLNKFSDISTLKKHQRTDMLSPERFGGSNPPKMGMQNHRNTSEIGGQRLEERSKNIVLNKRVRTSVAETRAEGRSNSIPRPSLQIGKDRDAANNSSDVSEEKIRRLPAGGEGWDKKMKRKRSVGTVFTKQPECDGELKRSMQPKIGNEQGLQSCDPHGFRISSYNSSNGINKLEGNPFSLNSHVRGMPKSEFEKVHISRDITSGLNKERAVAKVNNRSMLRDECQATVPLSKTKGKASRAPRMGPIVAECSSPEFSRPSGSLDCLEESQNLNKGNLIGGANRRRTIPSGPSSPPMAQWVGQRPHKISRTRRTNLGCPMSSHDEAQISPEGCPVHDFGANRVNGVYHTKDAGNLIQHKSKHENASSSAMMSESEDSGLGENRSKDKGIGSSEVDEKSTDSFHDMGNSMSISTKNKMFISEDITDGVRRQGRTGRSLSISRATISSNSEMENPVVGKPVRSSRPGSDKNGSKLGRPPLKKMSDRKAFSRLGQPGNGCASELTGEFEDDHEELVEAAKCANSACSMFLNSFWKKMGPIFSSVDVDDITFLNKQVKYTDELIQNPSHVNGYDSNNVKSVEEDTSMIGNGTSVMFDDPFREINSLSRHFNSEINKITPLYQRVLSALILDDENEVVEEKNERRNALSRFDKDESNGACLDINAECGKREVTGLHYDSLGFPKKQPTLTMFSINGCSGSDSSPRIYDPPRATDISQEGHVVMYPREKLFREYSQNSLNGFHEIHANISAISSCDFQYEHMPLDEKVLLELQSIGLFPDAVPDLTEGDDEVIAQEIAKLKEELHIEVSNKKGILDKLCKSLEERKELEEQEIERNAMDRLVELAYRKQQINRVNNSKNSITKASRQATLAFVKRTLARCRRFENTEENCFSDPALREIIFAPSSKKSDMDIMGVDVSPASQKPEIDRLPSAGMSVDASGRYGPQSGRGLVDAMGTSNCLSDQTFMKNGPVVRGKKKEVFLDDVGGNSAFRMSSSSLCNTLSGGVKGKRSDRDRDRDTRSSTAKIGRPSLGSIRGDRKAKPKPRQQKTSQLTTSGNKSSGSGPFMDSAVHQAVYSSANDPIANTTNRKEGVLVSSRNNAPADPMDFTNLQLQELESMGDLGIGGELAGNQDLSSWLNFDDDGLQDHDSMGLEIPMDDLSELNMLL